MFEEFLQRRGLSIERLHVLVQLSEAKSLIEAAGQDTGLQSRYSHYLRELSAFFGTPLTERAGKTLRLTTKGEELAKIAREQLRVLENFQRGLAETFREWKIGASDSLLQWLMIPALGKMRRPGRHNRYLLSSHRTNEIPQLIQEQKLDFGLTRTEATPEYLASKQICVVRHVVVVPRRLVHQRGILSLKKALLECPHAMVMSDEQLLQRVRNLAAGFDGEFKPELICDSTNQCIAAVRTGAYASVLPDRVIEPTFANDCIVVDEELEELDSSISIIWNPRTMDVLGGPAESVRDEIVDVLCSENEQHIEPS
jgi:DNA-binding transcriptional LysR family regulator